MCANSSIVCAGIIVGFLVGGPAGGAIGAGLATPLGILVETEIARTIKDPHLKAQFEEAIMGRYFYESLRNVLAAGAAGYLGRILGAQMASEFSSKALSEISKRFIGKGAGSLSEVAAYAFLKLYAQLLLGLSSRPS